MRAAKKVWVVLGMLISPAACAHLLGSAHGAGFDPWAIDYLALLLLLAGAAIYHRGHGLLLRKKPADMALFRKRNWQFWMGWWVLVLALCSPIDSFGEVLFSVHMVQHEMLMLMAGPLLVLSRPGSALVLGAQGLSVPVIRFLTTRNLGLMRALGWLLTPLGAWLVHFIGLWGWHIPWLFNASLNSDLLHSLQHITFMLIALVFWFSVFRQRGGNSMVAVIVLFTTAIHASLLGALLTFSPVVWYTEYLHTTQAWGLTALEDQQLGGLIMWMPAGIVFLAVALYLLVLELQPGTSSSAKD